VRICEKAEVRKCGSAEARKSGSAEEWKCGNELVSDTAGRLSAKQPHSQPPRHPYLVLSKYFWIIKKNKSKREKCDRALEMLTVGHSSRGQATLIIF
jgi:hypothetical protein